MLSNNPEINEMDDLFGFEAARARAEEALKNPKKNIDESLTFIPHRIFLNIVDSFNGNYLSSYLVDQIVGGLKTTSEEEGAEEATTENLPNGEENNEIVKPSLLKYEMIGCLERNYHKKSEDILFTTNENSEDYLENILKCGYVLYDITKDSNEIPKALKTLAAMDEKVEAMKELGPKTFKNNTEVRVFILISTIMTWALTKPIDPEEPSMPFTEIDYRKRKPHPNYKAHVNCEKEVVKIGRKNKDKLKTYVISSGIIYGAREEDLAFLFKMAWKNEEELPIFENGKNIVPLIHIKDLTKIVYGVMEKSPSKLQYILAVEQTPSKLKNLIKALSKTMGTGKTKNVCLEEAFLYSGITQTLFERYTVNLIMEPGYIVEGLAIEWQNELSLAENMTNIVNEYKNTRKLKPLKIILHGPPAVGKTIIAKQLVEYYGAHYINVKELIENSIQILEENIAKIKAKEDKEEEKIEEEEEEDELEEEEVAIEELEEQLKEILIALNENENGKLPDEQVINMMKKFLKSNQCKNQGYILDGYPKTIEQAKNLFGSSEEGEEEIDEEETSKIDEHSILPNFVIGLQATDEFLCNRIMSLPERDIQGSHYTEEHMLRRLKEFRNNNTEDNTPLNYFDEIEIHPLIIDVMNDNTKVMEHIVQIIKLNLGKPIEFEMTSEEEDEYIHLQEIKQQLFEKEAALQKQLAEELVVETHQNSMEEWTTQLEQLQMEEEKILVAQAEPLRHYMVKYIFPTLTKGLLEVARIKPHDPVDFLAEYLFKENPEGRMFDPSYTREGVRILTNFEENIEKDIDDSKSNNN